MMSRAPPLPSQIEVAGRDKENGARHGYQKVHLQGLTVEWKVQFCSTTSSLATRIIAQ